jgi:hypothetical protein
MNFPTALCLKSLLFRFGGAAALMAMIPGCSGDDSATSATTGESTDTTTAGSTTAASTTTDASTTDASTTATSETTGPDTAANGEGCSLNDDCASNACVKFTDFEEGSCEAGPDGGNTRITGTVFDFVSGATVAGAELKVVAALSALQNPAEATALVSGTSGADGKIDVTSTEPISAGIGIVGVISGADLYLAATGLASPVMGSSYGPLNAIHDVWAMPAAGLQAWSDLLVTDPEMAAYVPLGEKGGVVGRVRRRGTGAPVVGAKVVPETGTTSALIRYLSDGGDVFEGEVTGASGTFVLVNPGLAERFTVEIDGAIQEGTVGSAGSAKMGAVFMLILNVD